MRSLPALVLAGTLAAPLFAESPSGLAKEIPPASTQAGVTYEKDIRPLFEVSCFRCHGEKRQRGDLRLDSLEAALKGSEHGRVVVPGDSAKSPLVIAVARIDADTAMPPLRKGGSQQGGPAGAQSPPPALTPEQVGLVRAWIDQGAK
jgi:hypothetical protein